MKRSILKRTLASATALVTVAAVGVALTSHGDDSRHEATVIMPDAGPLEAGDEVRSAGVQVGEVKSVRLQSGQARVTLSLDSAVLPLHDDATITMRPINILGEDYLDLDRGTDSRPFATSAMIPASRTKVAGTLQDLLSTFQAPTAAALADVVTTAGEGLDGNGGNTAKTLAQLSSSMEMAQKLGDLLSQQNGVLSDLVTTTDPVVSALAINKGKTLDALLSSTTQALDAVTAQQTALKATIEQLPATLVSARTTLGRFAGVAREATPTLQEIKPLTSNLSQVVDELQDFTRSANPALTSLPAVLDKANALLDEAAPVVASLNQTGPHLARAAADLRPVSDQLLEKHLSGVMGFVRNWALSTNGYDGLGHYFRGVVYVTPAVLKQLLQSLVPAGLLDKTTTTSGAASTKTPAKNLVGGLTQTLGNTLSATNGLLGGLLGGGSGKGLLGGASGKGLLQRRSTDAVSGASSDSTDKTGAFGLTQTQEKSMLSQLLGGGQ